MQTLNCLVALGGDTRNTVPKTGITVAEAHLLRAIHGADALLDVEPLDDEAEARPKEEIARLAERYQAKDEDGRLVASVVFAGGAPSVPETIAELDLPETAFKVVSRVTAAPKKSRGRKAKDDAETGSALD